MEEQKPKKNLADLCNLRTVTGGVAIRGQTRNIAQPATSHL